MIYWPRDFDSNEWFVLIALALGAFVVYRLPKRFPTSLTVLIFTYAATMSRVTDHLLAGPVHKDFYDIMDWNKIEYFDILTYLFYGPYAYLFLHFYDQLRPRALGIPAYIILCSGLAVGVEWLADLCDVFTYKEWDLLVSLSIYLLVQSLTVWFFHFIKGKHAGVGPV